MIINISNIEAGDFENQLIELSKIYSKATMNINGFVRLLEDRKEIGYATSCFESVTSREVLRTGHYGNIGNMKIYCSKYIADDEMEIEK